MCLTKSQFLLVCLLVQLKLFWTNLLRLKPYLKNHIKKVGLWALAFNTESKIFKKEPFNELRKLSFTILYIMSFILRIYQVIPWNFYYYLLVPLPNSFRNKILQCTTTLKSHFIFLLQFLTACSLLHLLSA